MTLGCRQIKVFLYVINQNFPNYIMHASSSFCKWKEENFVFSFPFKIPFFTSVELQNWIQTIWIVHWIDHWETIQLVKFQFIRYRHTLRRLNCKCSGMSQSWKNSISCFYLDRLFGIFHEYFHRQVEFFTFSNPISMKQIGWQSLWSNVNLFTEEARNKDFKCHRH